MKCFYYLAPTLDKTTRIAQDLRRAGVHDWFMHVVSKDEAGLQRRQLHSSNYLETLGLLRDGVLGAFFGLIIGVIGSVLLAYFEPFGTALPFYVYFIVMAVATLFGAWEGGLLGVHKENHKLSRFRPDIDAGNHLILIYARKGQDEAIKTMMASSHPEAQHVATDRQLINPFAVVRRKRNQESHPAAS